MQPLTTMQNIYKQTRLHPGFSLLGFLLLVLMGSCEKPLPKVEKMALLSLIPTTATAWRSPADSTNRHTLAISAKGVTFDFEVKQPSSYPRSTYTFSTPIDATAFDALQLTVTANQIPFSRINLRIDFFDTQGVETNLPPLFELSNLKGTQTVTFPLSGHWQSGYPSKKPVNGSQIAGFNVFVNVGPSAPAQAQGSLTIQEVTLLKYPVPTQAPNTQNLLIKATATSTNRIRLAWNSATNWPQGYTIWRKPEQGEWNELATVTDTTFWDADLSAATAYQYKVVAFNTIGSGKEVVSAIVNTLAEAPTFGKLVWADEFETEQLDEKSWSYQTGNGCPELCGWGNNEKEFYTNSANNVEVKNGVLTLRAIKEDTQGMPYSSGRVLTKSKVDVTYGRIEARIKLPKGQGLWPAFWMLPTESAYGGWPRSGEIDIMEFLGHEPDKAIGTIHFGQPWPKNSWLTTEYRTKMSDFTESFHEFAVEWSANEIKWFIDGNHYATQTPQDVAPERWPFDQPFYIILNLAVGGNLPGEVGPNTAFPAEMNIDYVRVYQLP